ncbi:hypothetical protein V8D89_002867 [Ganoderma adspersum]
MFVPGVTEPSAQRLYRRKGGGGKGGGGKSGSSGRSGSSDPSGDSSSSNSKGSDGVSGSVGSRGSTVPVSGATNGRTTAVAYGSGTTRIVTIPQGQPFAGRTSGGATRDAVYGNSYYGSGYPGTTGLGVANRGFPFVFWPLVWGGGLGYGAAYLHDDREYGEPNNTTRPGGPMTQATFSSNTTTPPSTFHVVADNTTVTSLIASIQANCSISSNSSTVPVPFNASASDPLPEQAVQYFRASSVALTLDGYNNTAALAANANDSTPAPAPLPSGVDTALLDCLNATIGEAVPLFADSASGLPMPSMGLVGLVYVIWSMTSTFF